MAGWNNFVQAKQTGLNAELVNKAPHGSLGRDEKAALRRAKKAKMAFRIAKGYEKDSLLTRLKYWLKDR